MKRWHGLAAAVVLMICGPAMAQDLAKENAALRQQVEQLQKQNAELQAQIDALTRKTTELTQKNVDLEQEKMHQQEQLRQLFLATDYDEKADRTTAFTPSMKLLMLRGNGNDHWIVISADYPGKQPAAPVQQTTLVIAGWFTGDIYRNQQTMTLDIDGQPVDCPIVDYQVQSRRVHAGKHTIDQSDTQLKVRVPMSVIESIGKASTVTGRIGYVQFQLPREVNEACKAMAHTLAQ